MQEIIVCLIYGAKKNKEYYCSDEPSCEECERRFPQNIICPIDGVAYIRNSYCAEEQSCRICCMSYLKTVKLTESPKKIKPVHRGEYNKKLPRKHPLY